MLTVKTPQDLAKHIGTELGPSEWLTVDQAMIVAQCQILHRTCNDRAIADHRPLVDAINSSYGASFVSEPASTPGSTSVVGGGTSPCYFRARARSRTSGSPRDRRLALVRTRSYHPSRPRRRRP